jgi:glycosyltransferase involved in cell wall biosynthesis
MAVGLPLVVTDVGGNAEAVMDRVNGFVIRPDDAGALADALLALYRDPAARKHMGEKSRELVEQRYTVQEMCRRHAAFYLSLFEGKA